jgi:hypothetical protein
MTVAVFVPEEDEVSCSTISASLSVIALLPGFPPVKKSISPPTVVS